jgi:hypothetical protein
VGVLVEASVNVTASGPVPVVGVPEKSATGDVGAVTVIYPLLMVLL